MFDAKTYIPYTSSLTFLVGEPRIAAMLEGSKSEKKPLIKGIIEDKALATDGGALVHIGMGQVNVA